MVINFVEGFWQIQYTYVHITARVNKVIDNFPAVYSCVRWRFLYFVIKRNYMNTASDYVSE